MDGSRRMEVCGTCQNDSNFPLSPTQLDAQSMYLYTRQCSQQVCVYTSVANRYIYTCIADSVANMYVPDSVANRYMYIPDRVANRYIYMCIVYRIAPSHLLFIVETTFLIKFSIRVLVHLLFSLFFPPWVDSDLQLRLFNLKLIQKSIESITKSFTVAWEI